LYFLVYFGVLRDDESVQLAHENRIVPLPDVRWWQSNAHADPNSDSYADRNSNTDTDAHSYSDTNADASACTECAEQFGGDCRFGNTDQSVVDGQFQQRNGFPDRALCGKQLY
jgi:hypothetical protein